MRNMWLNLIEGESLLRGWLSSVLDGWWLIRHFPTSSLSDRDSHQYVFRHTQLGLEDEDKEKDKGKDKGKDKDKDKDFSASFT